MSIMYALLTSTGLIAISEMGDKTQLLALLLAAQFRKPSPIVLGIFVATVLNHAAAAWAGEWVASTVDPTYLRWALGLLFIGMAVSVFSPDSLAQRGTKVYTGSAFVSTGVTFFLAEIGNKDPDRYGSTCRAVRSAFARRCWHDSRHDDC